MTRFIKAQIQLLFLESLCVDLYAEERIAGVFVSFLTLSHHGAIVTVLQEHSDSVTMMHDSCSFTCSKPQLLSAA